MNRWVGHLSSPSLVVVTMPSCPTSQQKRRTEIGLRALFLILSRLDIIRGRFVPSGCNTRHGKLAGISLGLNHGKLAEGSSRRSVRGCANPLAVHPEFPGNFCYQTNAAAPGRPVGERVRRVCVAVTDE